MGIVSVHEISSGRSAEFTPSERKYTKVYRVITSSPADGPKAVTTAAGIPTAFTPYVGLNGELDTYARVASYSPRQDAENPYIWTVTVQYSTRPTAGLTEAAPSGPGTRDPSQSPANQEDPTLRPPVISYGFKKYTKVFSKNPDDPTSAPTNSAGDPFDPPVMVDDNRPVLTITRCELLDPFQKCILYQDSINSDSFYGATPYQLKMESITARSQYENGIKFWEVTYTIEARREGWDKIKILDQGFYYLDGSGNPKLMTVNSQPRVTPGLLDGHGGQLNVALSNTPKFREFVAPYKKLPFANLNL